MIEKNNAPHHVMEDSLPPKPREPDLSECCQRNCIDCVFVHYQKALERWREKVEQALHTDHLKSER